MMNTLRMGRARRAATALPLALSFVLGLALSLAATAARALAQDIAIVGGTLLTVDGAVIEDGVLVCQAGKITAVGRRGEVTLPDGIAEIDARGRFVMPGIIDTHSHMGVYPWTYARGNSDGNEATAPATPQVRAEDSVYLEDPAFARARAGGVTAALVLPGSANLVGGEGVVLKLRPEPSLDGMRFEGAPRQLKMAFGENPKRVYGGRNQLPSTRMGNLAALRDGFQRAREYDQRRRRSESSYPRPEHDPVLEGLAGVLRNELRLQVHCYTLSDILGLLRLADEQGFRVASIHHALEAYKAREELARRGIGVCTWADWWGFKQEAWDAIPDNAALCAAAGVTVSIHSDSSDGIQRLFLEAAKTVATGMPEADALAAITLGPARILGLEDRVGSLTVGKDADIAIFSRHPFDVATRVEHTLIDGRVVYDRAAAEEPAAPKEAPPSAIAIVGGTVLPVAGPPIKRGTVLVQNGRILAVGGADLTIPAGFARIDATGKVVFPGLIDAASTVGLVEVSYDDSLRETDGTGGIFLPHLRVTDGLEPDSETIRVARIQGVTTSLVTPGEQNAIGGRAAIVDLDGGTVAAMVVRDPAALCVTIGSEAIGRGRSKGVGARMELIAELREQLVKAAAYRDKLARHEQELARWTAREARRKAAPSAAPKSAPDDDKDGAEPQREAPRERRSGNGDGDGDGEGADGKAGKDRADSDKGADEKERDSGSPPIPPTRDLALEALLPVLAGELPVLVSCHRERDIRAALALADEFSLRLILRRATAAHRLAPLLAERKIPIVLGPVTTQPSGFETRDAIYENAALCHDAGVLFALHTGSSHDVRRLRIEAGIATAYGLSPEAALRAITLDAARILGIEADYGSIEPGKVANLVVADGAPLEPRTRIERVLIRGREVDLRSRQTDLLERFGPTGK